MPPRRTVLRANLTAGHLFHLATGRTFFGDVQGGYGGIWPEYPFDEARCRQAWQAVRPVFLPWWQARYPQYTPCWAQWYFDQEGRGQWRRWEWDVRQGRLLAVLEEFLTVHTGTGRSNG